MVEGGALRSVIFWGPPGAGKTTLALLLGAAVDRPFLARSAVTSTMPEVRSLLQQARRSGRGLVLFLDEIHRFNKLQQDAFLPFIEDGSVVLLGATTENPSFEVNAALLSRCQVERLVALDAAGLGELLDRALADPEQGYGGQAIELEPAARERICTVAAGDARVALNLLEAAVATFPLRAGGTIDTALVDRVLGDRALGHDRGGDAHFDLASALQKSIRGADAQAAIYYLARLLEAGEPPNFVARRLVVTAAEDIGLADPGALQLAVAAQQAAHVLGMPEARIPLAELTIYLATAPHSRSAVTAYDRAADAVRTGRQPPVPFWLRNVKPAALREEETARGEDLLPTSLGGTRFYEPVETGFEREVARRLAYWLRRRGQRRGEEE
jgi:putative ATPase